MLEKDVRIIKKKGVYHIVNSESGLSKSWFGGSFSFVYDIVMKRCIFPGKFGGDMSLHYEILSRELAGIHGKNVLEVASGTGSAVNFVSNDNRYAGTDISPGLLKKAVRNFRDAGFDEADFYVAGADNLPFDDAVFSVCLCILSLNFFPDAGNVFREIKRVLIPGGVLICSVPVPDRNRLQSKIRGNLFSETELENMCREAGFQFENIPAENGALLYFKAIKQ